MNVLVVDSDKFFCKSIKKALSKIDSIDNVDCLYSDEKIPKMLKEDSTEYDIGLIDIKTVGEGFNYLNCVFPNCRIIGLSSSSKEINRYINKSYVDRFFKKPVEVTSIVKYLEDRFDIKNSDNTFDKEELFDELVKIGFSLCHKGTLYMVDCIIKMAQNPGRKAIDIYEEVAKDNNTITDQVCWSLNNALKKAVYADKNNKMGDYFCFSDGRKPSVKYIINYFATLYEEA